MNNEHMFDIAKGCALEARKMGDLKKLISLSKIQLSTLQSLVKNFFTLNLLCFKILKQKNYAKLTQLMDGSYLGRKNNIKTPYNSVVTSLIKAQELEY